jgi:hypothetical protein
MRQGATRTHSRTVLTALAAVAVALLSAAPARADVGETIILRCTHQESLAGFTPSDYAKALKELVADAEEYTNCASLIRQAELAAASGHGGGNAEASVPLVATPAEQKAIASAQRKAPGPLAVGGRPVAPGVVHANVASAFSTLPTPLLALLAVLLAGLGALGARPLRDRLRGRRPD